MSTPPASRLDASQVLQHAFDDDVGRLRVEAEVSATIGSVDVIIDASTDSIAVSDGVNTLLVNPDGSINTVTAIDTAGLATEDAQDTGNTSLSSIDTKLSSQATASKQDLLLAELQLKADLTETQPVSIASLPALVAGSAVIGHIIVDSVPTVAVTGAFYQATQPISAAALPLPSGAATSALQSTQDTSINSLLKPSSTLAAVTSITNVVHIDDNASSITVDSTNLDIRDLVFASDKVDVSGSIIDLGSTSLNALETINANLLNGVISTVNSTTAPLGVGATFTGTYEDITNYTATGIFIATDRNGTLFYDSSTDGVNLDKTESYPVAVTVGGVTQGFFFQAQAHSKYYRIRYTNDGTIQGVFRLQTIIRNVAGTAEVLAVNIPMLGSTDALTTKSVIYGVTTAGGGAYVAVKVNPSGTLTADVSGSTGLVAAVTGSVTANAGTNLNTSALALDSTVAKDSSLSTLNTSVNTLLKPANTLAAVTTVSTVTNLAQLGGAAVSMNTGVRDAGTQRVTVATNDVVPVTIATAPVLVAGSAIIGKVGIDQTTPGTTNLVALTAETTKVIGTVNVSTKGSFRASTIIPLVAAVTVNVPFFNIIGSATKTVIVKRIKVSGMTLTAVGYFAINVEKLSAASTAGTSTTLTTVPLDSTVAGTAVVKAYTVAPGKGALVGTVDSFRCLWQATVAAAAGMTDQHVFNFGDIAGSGGIVLRGVAQELCLTFPVVLATAGTLSVSVEWTEE